MPPPPPPPPLHPLLGHPKLQPYFRQLVPHEAALAPHLVRLIDFLEYVEPWLPVLMPELSRLLPYLDALLDELPYLTPHLEPLLAQRERLLPCLAHIVPHMPALRPHLPRLVAALPTVGPYVGRLAPHLGVLLPHLNRMLPALSTLADASLDLLTSDAVLPHVLPHLESFSRDLLHLERHLPPLIVQFERDTEKHAGGRFYSPLLLTASAHRLCSPPLLAASARRLCSPSWLWMARSARSARWARWAEDGGRSSRQVCLAARRPPHVHLGRLPPRRGRPRAPH